MKAAVEITSDSYVKVSVREKIGYGFGDLASNLSFGFVSLFLLFFYTNIYGITAVQASLIFVIARILDALFNIFIGYFIDKTHTRHGKLRPYLLYGAVPLGILTVLCFSTFDSEFKFYYALISYTVYCLAYTTVNTPYSAMTNMLTQHEGSRASLSVYRFVLAIVGYLIVSTSADLLISQFTDQKMGYVFAVSCFSLLATFFFLACFGMTKERVVSLPDQKPPTLKEMITAVSGNLPLINLSMFTVFFYIAYTVWMAIAIYFIKYQLGDEAFTAKFFAIQSAAYVVGTILSEKLISLMGKKKMVLLALLVGIAGVSFQYFMAGDNSYLVMTGVCLFSITLGMGFVAMWSMIADTVEYAEWKHGVRTEGAIYGFFNFITKIAMAIGGGCAGLMLDYFDYSSDHISTNALNGINLMMTLFPGLMFALGMVFIFFYALDENTYRNIIKDIESRKLVAQ
ncbi:MULTISPECIES: MFS transporter [Serratia]|jgi:GPH family glycoside/pentoside/hexuronide:cation symporter|uniref:MFS transporter n=1 Tax=Serratia grimesii TaxID=82995 RepID=A0A7G2JP88_9GAMM|nr:glycoside-pentoside-hexuronide (GPH):cation symporter [Serratia grimesii]CAI1176466.1 Inner membrane symporter yihP [Serratia grimesii]CAI1587548.1 Inner membrane symporter yihP [Serratia grimesii]CAI2431630.1 Inner membrane symporter yihP [Serratia grimesii]CAI2790547.1 Inner membrane symporter yihP [Serratia grimesii]CUW18387.1 putative symporter YjmB [Serratia grimesii]